MFQTTNQLWFLLVIYRTSIHGGYKFIVQFIVNGGRYTQMLLLVLKMMNPNIYPCPKSPSFVGQYTSTMLRIKKGRVR